MGQIGWVLSDMAKEQNNSPKQTKLNEYSSVTNNNVATIPQEQIDANNFFSLFHRNVKITKEIFYITVLSFFYGQTRQKSDIRGANPT
jgi:hypothetical protein